MTHAPLRHRKRRAPVAPASARIAPPCPVGRLPHIPLRCDNPRRAAGRRIASNPVNTGRTLPARLTAPAWRMTHSPPLRDPRRALCGDESPRRAAGQRIASNPVNTGRTLPARPPALAWRMTHSPPLSDSHHDVHPENRQRIAPTPLTTGQPLPARPAARRPAQHSLAPAAQKDDP